MKRRGTTRVKLPIRQAHELEATLYNVREFCAMRDASEELMGHIASCQANITRAIDDRNRVAGIARMREAERRAG